MNKFYQYAPKPIRGRKGNDHSTSSTFPSIAQASTPNELSSPTPFTREFMVMLLAHTDSSIRSAIHVQLLLRSLACAVQLYSFNCAVGGPQTYILTLQPVNMGYEEDHQNNNAQLYTTTSTHLPSLPGLRTVQSIPHTRSVLSPNFTVVSHNF